MTTKLSLKAEEVFKAFKPQGLLNEISGNPQTPVSRIAGVENCKTGDLVFISKKDFLEQAKAGKPSVVVTTLALKELVATLEVPCVIISNNVNLAHALIKQKYMDRDYSKTGWSKIHPSAVVHETAKIDTSVTIEPHCVIGMNTVIGKDTRIMAGTVIENDVTIGKNVTIHPRVVVGYGTQIGNEVIIESGSVIGSEGFGFAQDQKRKSYTLPQTGIVVIEDRVRVGANNCIDRAAYETTRIGAGTKLDNFCHIAHNVQIGEDCLLTAFFCVAGTTEIGDRMTASGQTGIIDHRKICNDVTLVQRAAVFQDIEVPGVYAGTPLQPMSEYLKNAATIKEAYALKKRIIEIEKKLGIEKK